MMKRFFLLLPLLLLFLSSLRAQDLNCEPDTTILDSVQFISPQPRVENDTVQAGGIPDTACVDQPFEFTFTVFAPSQVNFPGVGDISIVDLRFDPDTAISYQPALESFDYVCNPPDCVFQPEEAGCVKIFGTATAEETGAHELLFAGSVNIGIPIPIVFPDPTLFPGTYEVHVQEQGSPYCLSASREDYILSGFDIRNAPNPFSYTTDILVDAEVSGRYEFLVHDMLGKTVHRRVVDILEGSNTISFDGSNLPNGMYTFMLSDGRAVITQKMIISRR